MRREAGMFRFSSFQMLSNLFHRRFSGDEAFDPSVTGKDAPSLDAGSGLGVVIEGKRKSSLPVSPSRL